MVITDTMAKFYEALAMNTYSENGDYVCFVESIAAQLGIDISDPEAFEWFNEFCLEHADTVLGPSVEVMQFSINGIMKHYFPSPSTQQNLFN